MTATRRSISPAELKRASVPVLSDLRTPVVKPVEVEDFVRKHYEVEVVQKGNNVIYHFFPRKGSLDFYPDHFIFGTLMEDAFVWAASPNLDTQADYYNKQDAKAISRASEPNHALGQPTFCLQVFDVMDRIGAERVMGEKFLGRLDHLLDRVSRELMSKSAEELRRDMLRRRWRD